MLLLYILLATLIDSSLALVGALSLFLKKGVFEKLIFALVAFSAGALLSGAFFHMLAESLEKMSSVQAFVILFIGFCLFFIIERALHWHHCHEGSCKVHPVSWLIILGDGIHNFIDGAVIAASFMMSVPFGIITTLLIIIHEVPQELGDFAVLVYSGMKRTEALFFNFISQAVCIVGALFTYFVFLRSDFVVFLLPFAAGGFIYIAASDLIPELHKEENLKRSVLSFLLFLFGLGFMLAMKLLFE
jgi:zinc and cadmium transporter